MQKVVFVIYIVFVYFKCDLVQAKSLKFENEVSPNERSKRQTDLHQIIEESNRRIQQAQEIDKMAEEYSHFEIDMDKINKQIEADEEARKKRTSGGFSTGFITLFIITMILSLIMCLVSCQKKQEEKRKRLANARVAQPVNSPGVIYSVPPTNNPQ